VGGGGGPAAWERSVGGLNAGVLWYAGPCEGVPAFLS